MSSVQFPEEIVILSVEEVCRQWKICGDNYFFKKNEEIRREERRKAVGGEVSDNGMKYERI